MEAPLHHSPVPMPLPPAPPQQHDATFLQQAAAAAMTVRNSLPPPPPPPPISAMTGREQCPRCASRDTKFCYYNNYNTAQPRHFCRACRRYWTLGGSLRNVPVGGSTCKRPRPARPARAATLAAAAAAMTATSPPTTAAAASSSRCPFGAAAVTVPAPAPTQNGGCGLLSSLLLGSVPLLEGRLGFDLGLGQPAVSSTTGAGDLAQLGFSAGPLLYPATVLEGDRAAPETTPWKSGAASAFPPALMWQELAAATMAPTTGPSVGLHHGATTPLLL